MAQDMTEVINVAIAIVNGQKTGDTYNYVESATDASDPTAQWASRLADKVIEEAICILKPPECRRYPRNPTPVLAANQYDFPEGFEYIYSRPPECLLFLGVYDTVLDARNQLQPVPFMRIGQQIGVKQEDVLVGHVVKLASPIEWSEPLTHVIVNLLAFYLCGPLRVNQNTYYVALKVKDQAISDAQCRQAESECDHLNQDSESVAETY